MKWMARAKPNRTAKRKKTTAKRVEPRTSAFVTVLVGLIFGGTLAAGGLGLYQLFKGEGVEANYPSVVLIPSHTPTATPIPVGWAQVEEYSVPILMYHYIRPVPMRDEVGRGLSVSPEKFREQLDYLAKHGYTPVTFSQLQQKVLPKKPVILTFDDGLDNAYTAAFPELNKHKMAGVFYIISGSVDHPGSVTWDQLREMQSAGMEIGAHTVSHPDLAKSSEHDQQQQIFDSISQIQEHLGQPVITFAYPSGKWKPETVKLVEAAGITYSVTTEPGIAASTDNPQLLPRFRVNDGSDFSLLLGN